MSEAKPQTARRPAVTLKQIADRVGVSVATVSRVLNFDASLSVTDQTRQAIVETAAAMNYEPPRQRRKRNADPASRTKVALLHFLKPEEELADPYYVSLRLGIESRCASLQLEPVKLYHSDQYPDAALLRDVAGLIAIGLHSADEIAWITAQNPNVVFADFNPGNDGIDAVESDLEAATRKLLAALTELGYRRIAFAGWVDRAEADGKGRPEKRCTAYREWMSGRGQFVPERLAIGRNTSASGYELARQLLEVDERPDVLITSNDNMAVGAYRAIHELGLRIPEDIAVASFNDISTAQFMSPPLTTVHLPAEQIGENAVDLLVERRDGRRLAKRVVLESRVVWRDSTRKPLALQPE